jgi:hypothetical protein
MGNHLPGVLVYGLLVEGVEDGHLRRSACGLNVLGDRLKLLAGAPREEDPGSLVGEGASDRAADRAASSVDHGVLVLQQHCLLSFH